MKDSDRTSEKMKKGEESFLLSEHIMKYRCLLKKKKKSGWVIFLGMFAHQINISWLLKRMNHN